MKDLMKRFGFRLEDLLPIAMVLVVAGIGIAFGLNVMADVQDDFTAGTAEYNATQDAIDANSNLAERMPLLATVVVAAIIIGVLVRYLFGQFRTG